MADAKSAARRGAFARRKAAFEADRLAGFPAVDAVAEALCKAVSGHAGPIAGYMPIRTELSPLRAMARLAEARVVGVPVIHAPGQPLIFHRWHRDAEMVEGPFGARVPHNPVAVVPRVLIVPLVAFDRRGGRLGYGGGFYDRTLAELRAAGPILALGLAYAAQEAEALPQEPTDATLDGIITEAGFVDVAPLRH